MPVEKSAAYGGEAEQQSQKQRHKKKIGDHSGRGHNLPEGKRVADRDQKDKQRRQGQNDGVGFLSVHEGGKQNRPLGSAQDQKLTHGIRPRFPGKYPQDSGPILYR